MGAHFCGESFVVNHTFINTFSFSEPSWRLSEMPAHAGGLLERASVVTGAFVTVAWLFHGSVH
jgi:hypothetical protein